MQGRDIYEEDRGSGRRDAGQESRGRAPNTPGAMEITYTLSADDWWHYQQFSRAHRLHLPPALFHLLDAAYLVYSVWLAWRLAGSLWSLRFLLGTGIPGARLLFLVDGRQITNFVLISLVLAYLLFGVRFFAQRRAALSPGLFETTTRILRPDALYTLAAGKKSFLPWGRFETLAEDRHCLYFCLNRKQAIILPKRAFGDRAASAEFLRQARAAWQEARANPEAGAAKRPWPASAASDVWPPPPAPRPAPTVRIRIIATVPGEAPEEVRRAWTGLILPALGGPDGGRHQAAGRGVLSGRPTGEAKGYRVPTDAALEVLARAHPEAAQWWRDNAPPLPGHALLFPADVCEVVPG